MNKDYYCVIMAGGVGARFWPLSRNSRPKQFIDILGTGETLIQQTFRRLTTICPPENIFEILNFLMGKCKAVLGLHTAYIDVI